MPDAGGDPPTTDAGGDRRRRRDRCPQSLERYRGRRALPDTAPQGRTQSLGPVRERYIGGPALPDSVLEWFERDGPDEMRDAKAARAAELDYRRLNRILPAPKKEEQDEIDHFRLETQDPEAAAAKAVEKAARERAEIFAREHAARVSRDLDAEIARGGRKGRKGWRKGGNGGGKKGRKKGGKKRLNRHAPV